MRVIDFFRIKEAQKLDKSDINTALIYPKILERKPFLKKLFLDFYCELQKRTCGETNIVEIGSGHNVIKEVMPDVITSDILDFLGVDKCFSAFDMPFDDGSVDAFVGIDVFHHFVDVRAFLKEVCRCLKPGGKLVLIEPSNTLFGGFVWKYFHTENFDIKGGWGFEYVNYNSANGALPWIVFCRDRRILEKEFPLKVKEVKCHTPFKFLFAGGFIYKGLPLYFYNKINLLEYILSFFNKFIGMFYTIEIEKCMMRNRGVKK